MVRTYLSSVIVIVVTGLALSLAVTGCSQVAASKPVIVISSPPSGTQVNPNSPVDIQAKATDAAGIVRIDLLVNGVVVASQTAPTAGGEPEFSADLHWTPATLGNQVVEVIAYDVNGASSDPTAVNIVVQQALAVASPTATAPPTVAPTASPPTAEATSPITPTATNQPAATTVVQSSLQTQSQTQTQSQPPKQPQVKPQVTQAVTSQPPNAPSNFKAVATGTTIKFDWTDNSNDEMGFRFYQTGLVSPVLSIAPLNGTGNRSTAWDNLHCGVSATYEIRAFNNAGESSPSNTSVTGTVPCAPTSLVAFSSAYNAITFDWSVAQRHDETGFNIYEAGVTKPIATRGPNAGWGGTFYVWSLVPCDTRNGFLVRAFNAAGESGDSNSATAGVYPCAPTDLTIISVATYAFAYSFTDNSAFESGFKVYKDDKFYTVLTSHPGRGHVVLNQAQPCNEHHVWSLTAYDAAGESKSSEHVGVTTPKCP